MEPRSGNIFCKNIYVAAAPIYVAAATIYVAAVPIYVAAAPIYEAAAPIYVAATPDHIDFCHTRAPSWILSSAAILASSNL